MFMIRAHRPVVLGLLACACSSSSDSGANSASAKFCADFNAVSCQRLFECTPEAERKEPFFVALFGNSASECASRWTDLCRHPKPDIQADVSCPDGWSVNESKAMMCLNQVRTGTCQAIEDPATLAPCETVCTPGGGGAGGSSAGGSGGATGGSGGSTGTGGTGGSTGTGGTGGAVTLSETEKFCRDTVEALCGRIFACFTPAERAETTFKQAFGTSVAECTVLGSSDCYGAGNMCNLNRNLAQMCISQVGALSCASILAGVPDARQLRIRLPTP